MSQVAAPVAGSIFGDSFPMLDSLNPMSGLESFAGGTAMSRSGDLEASFGGINVGSNVGSPFTPTTIAVGVGLVALYLIAKKQNFI